MPVPKQRRSKSKKRTKKATWKIDAPQLRPCPECGLLTLPHRACVHCGQYKGRQVVKIKEKVSKKES